MQLQRERDTGPEMALRRRLHALGRRYRVDLAVVPGAPRRRVDLVFTRARVAVFVDGCFWHGCPEHGRREHNINGWYWPDKIAGNRRRDADTNERLSGAGWTVLRIWEHVPVDEAVALVTAALTKELPRRGSGDAPAEAEVQAEGVSGVRLRRFAGGVARPFSGRGMLEQYRPESRSGS